jgi:hypothetical protein
MVTTKVIVFPVRGRRWAFAAQAATPVASSSSSSSVSQLWKRLLSVPKFTDRAQLLEQYVSTKVCVHFLSANQLASIIATSYGERQEIHSLVTEEEPSSSSLAILFLCSTFEIHKATFLCNQARFWGL